MSAMSDDFTSPKPFKVNIPLDEVERMRRLIADTRLPDQPALPGASWDYGVDLGWLKDMRDAWLNDFDWKEVEQEMNAFNHYTVVIESVTLHFIHHRSARPDATPIMLLHGWPGSFWEFHKMVDLLANPPADQPAFDVVIPSLPGFGFSSAPPRQGWTMADNARIFDHLMTGVLGYPAYMAEGGDYGAFICIHLGSGKYPACKLLDFTGLPAQPPLTALLTLPFFLLPTAWRTWLYGKLYGADDLADFARSGRFVQHGLGYFVEQATRPFSVGYALHDSPVGLLAWVGEKYQELVDPALLPQSTRFVLTTVSLYYLTRTFVTSTLPYHENPLAERLVVTKPYGASRFPYDVLHVPVSWIKKQHPNMKFVRRHEHGGHFPGFEVPELLAMDLRELVSSHRDLLV